MTQCDFCNGFDCDDCPFSCHDTGADREDYDEDAWDDFDEE